MLSSPPPPSNHYQHIPARLIPIIGLIGFEALADYFATIWGTQNSSLYIAIIAIVLYLICNIFWLFALKNGVGLGKGNIIFAVGSSICAICLGVFIFGESYTKTQLIGLLLGLVSILLVNME